MNNEKTLDELPARLKELYCEDDILRITSSWAESPIPVEGRSIEQIITGLIDRDSSYFFQLGTLLNQHYQNLQQDKKDRHQVMLSKDDFERCLYWQKINEPETFFARHRSLISGFKIMDSLMTGFFAESPQTFPAKRTEAFFDLALMEIPDAKYKVLMPLFSGTCSSTCLVENNEGKQFVLKVPHPSLRNRASTINRVVQEKDLEAMIESEAEILQTLPEHENILKVVEIIPLVLNGRATKGLVSEKIDFSETLQNIFAYQGTYFGPLSKKKLSQAADYGLQLASTLKHLCEHGVMHKDVWGGNILVAGNKARLIDFGFAEKFSELTWIQGKRTITPPLSVPAEKYDLWSLGATFYSLFTGEDSAFPRCSQVCSKMFHRIDYEHEVDYAKVLPLFRNVVRNLLETVELFDYHDVKAAMNLIKDRLYLKEFDEKNAKLIAAISSDQSNDSKLEIISSGSFTGVRVNGSLAGYLYKDEYFASMKQLTSEGNTVFDLNLPRKVRVMIADREDYNADLQEALYQTGIREIYFYKSNSIDDLLQLNSSSFQDIDLLLVHMPYSHNVKIDRNLLFLNEVAKQPYLPAVKKMEEIKRKYPLLDVVVYTGAGAEAIKTMTLDLELRGVHTAVNKTMDCTADVLEIFKSIGMLRLSPNRRLEIKIDSSQPPFEQSSEQKVLFTLYNSKNKRENKEYFTGHKIMALNELYLPDNWQILCPD